METSSRDTAGFRVARVYAPDDVRDARIVHQLRQAGYRIPQLRHASRWDEVGAALAAREVSLNSRSRQLIEAAAALAYGIEAAGR